MRMQHDCSRVGLTSPERTSLGLNGHVLARYCLLLTRNSRVLLQISRGHAYDTCADVKFKIKLYHTYIDAQMKHIP